MPAPVIRIDILSMDGDLGDGAYALACPQVDKLVSDAVLARKALHITTGV